MRFYRDRELIAFPMVVVMLGIMFGLFAAFHAGLWAWLLAGAVGLAAAALITWVYARRHRHPARREAPRPEQATVEGASHHVLVIADDTCNADALQAAVSARAAGKAIEAFVVAPALGSRMSRWTGDERAYEAATEHLDATLRALVAAGVEARGKVGSHDPIQAADDGLREFPADELVLAVHTGPDANRLEDGLADLVRERYDLPVTTVPVAST